VSEKKHVTACSRAGTKWMGDCSKFWYIYYPDNKTLNVHFIAHLTHCMWLSYLGKLSNP